MEAENGEISVSPDHPQQTSAKHSSLIRKATRAIIHSKRFIDVGSGNGEGPSETLADAIELKGCGLLVLDEVKILSPA